jgi:hypothetical protein
MTEWSYFETPGQLTSFVVYFMWVFTIIKFGSTVWLLGWMCGSGGTCSRNDNCLTGFRPGHARL